MQQAIAHVRHTDGAHQPVAIHRTETASIAFFIGVMDKMVAINYRGCSRLAAMLYYKNEDNSL